VSCSDPECERTGSLETLPDGNEAFCGLGRTAFRDRSARTSRLGTVIAAVLVPTSTIGVGVMTELTVHADKKAPPARTNMAARCRKQVRRSAWNARFDGAIGRPRNCPWDRA
jgi:hypothetical protein